MLADNSIKAATHTQRLKHIHVQTEAIEYHGCNLTNFCTFKIYCPCFCANLRNACSILIRIANALISDIVIYWDMIVSILLQ